MQIPECLSGFEPSRLEIISAIVAIVYPLNARKPLFALPDVALSHARLDDRDPPIVKDKNAKADHPLYKDPAKIVDTEQYHPQTAVLAPLGRQLHVRAAAFRTSFIYSHTNTPAPGSIPVSLYIKKRSSEYVRIIAQKR